MHHNELIGNRKSFAVKVVFFLALITFSIMMYLESSVKLDIAYAFVVMILFIKFLKLKLYQ